MKILPPNPFARGPLRIWMTGSLAVVMTAMVNLRAGTEAEVDADETRTRRVAVASPYGLAETVLRIESAATARGLRVLWRDARGDAVIVLGSSGGGTPVAFDGAAPEAPMALRVLASPDGGTRVWLPAEVGVLAGALRRDAPQAADELALLPQLVRRALG